ncbi:hypothetical protein DW322_18445 [Rhodococcus rhodnii]|uniref:Integral membrane protein n=1 Tax=Rhodococcus rhodnii TaxID=38312 RepID=A0A6P2CIV6_9NOCA|nr:hypothetical protein [Rhodococcus rhodnii]TXG91800.1 hypothetical protein DW322_18445 [Rhodococcus rhodnii]
MSFLYSLLVVVHMLGLAALVGGYFAVLKTPRVTEVIVWGARIQFLSGLFLVGLGEAALDKDYNHIKIGVKLLISLIVVALAEVARAKQNKATTPAPGSGGTAATATAAPVAVAPMLVHAVGILAIVNILVAVIWH